MKVAAQPSENDRRENVFLPQARYRVVEPLDVRQTAAEHNHLWIKDVDHNTERLGQASLVAPERFVGRRFAVDGARPDLLGGQALATMSPMISRHARPRQPGFDTAQATTIAGQRRHTLFVQQGQRVVAPFAGNSIDTGNDALTNDDVDERRCRRPPRCPG